MTEALTLYTHPMSRGRITRWMLEETGADYRTEIVGYGPAMKSPDYLAINPMGKVPAIRHGDTIVTECAAICAYLADAFPAAELAPAPADRGAYYRWLFFAAGPLEAAVSDKVLGVEVPEDKQGMIGYGTFAAVIDVLEKCLPRDGYIAGDRFSAADVYLGSHLGWGLEFGSIDHRPIFEDYVGRMRDRDAYRRAKAMDDEAMPKEQQQAS
ncbi:MAG: glutathione S-transferase family protein [Alphaproteobacteria bacterium]